MNATLGAAEGMLVLSGAGALPALALARVRLVAIPLFPLSGAILASLSVTAMAGLGGSFAGWFVVLSVASALAVGLWWWSNPGSTPWSHHHNHAPNRLVTLVAAVAGLVTAAFGLSSLSAPAVGGDARAIWLLHPIWYLNGHAETVAFLRDKVYGFSHPPYPPLVGGSVAMSWLVSGLHTDRLGVIMVALLNACAVLAAASAMVEMSHRLSMGAGPSRRRAVLGAGIVVGVALIMISFDVAGMVVTNGLADLLWASAAVGAVAYGLVLPVQGMRLHIHHKVGSGDGLFGSDQRDKEPITVTPAEIIYQRRIAVLEHAQRTGNVAETCRVFSISRTRYYQWKNVADRYGLDALMPKARRAPQMPDATPTHVIQALLTLAVVEPTIGCRQYADRLGDRGLSIAKSTVQKHLVAHGLGRRSERLARAAAITAATTGLETEAARDDKLFGFCLATGGPGELVCLDSFYIGKLKGVGKVYQLSAIDVFTRWAIVMIVIGPVDHTHSIHFIEHILSAYRRHGVKVRAVLTDNGPEYVAGTFRAHLVAKELGHQRIPARSPNHNAVCERFHQTILQECWRPAFHRRHFTSIRQLQAEADSWLVTYNHRRRNHGDYMRGRTPHQVLDNHRKNKAA